MLRTKLATLCNPAARACIAASPGSPSLGNPFVACDEPMFCTPRKTNIVPLLVRATLVDAGDCRASARWGAIRDSRPDEGDM
jgi:hypothetical protein